VTDRGRREYAEALRPHYQRADRRERGRLLDEYCRATGCHRKTAIRVLRQTLRPGRRAPGRPRRYGPALLPALERAWVASDHLCGRLLAPVLPTLLQALERHHGLILSAPTRAALLAASPATLDRRQRRRQPYRVSPATAALRQQIPLRTWSEWAHVRPGALQGDLVLHCGESTAGFYLATLLAVDVATTWTELEIVWGLGQARVGSAVHHIRQRLPVPLREWHTDNGGEFLNEHLVAWGRREGVHVTRGRPYRKNDQAWVEQRNGLVIRRLIGYDRFSSRAACSVFQRLYRLLRLQLNFFRPVRKLLSKRRLGARVVKRYDAAQTPYQRLLAAGALSPAQREVLDAQLQTLDPIALAREIEQTLDLLWKLADTRRPGVEVARG
jgi:hypothetical protein